MCGLILLSLNICSRLQKIGIINSDSVAFDLYGILPTQQRNGGHVYVADLVASGQMCWFIKYLLSLIS